MWTSTKKTLLWKIYDILWINKRFCEYSHSTIDPRDEFLVIPCDGTVEHIWIITESDKLIGKHGKEVSLERVYWEKLEIFAWHQYISLYLSPQNRHFFTSPCDGRISYTKKHDGDATIPYIMALEKFWIQVFKEYIEHNAAVWSIIENWNTTLWMIALGSLNVNRIVLDKDVWEPVSRWEKIGHFLMGSGIILIVPSDFKIQKRVWESVTIGESIIKK